MTQPHRLTADAGHRFGGAEIDRSKPLSFRLNGRTYGAFAGDTVLSAVLAAGVDGAGTHNGGAIGLDERFAPPVANARDAAYPARAMPMDRVPVLAGLDLVTLGPRLEPLRLTGIAARVANLVGPPSRSLGHRLDDPAALAGPWLQLLIQHSIEADTVIVGGGVAGMSAALAAAQAGGSVVLIERRPMLGGDARFFGTVGDEEPPDTTIAKLSERIAKTDRITLMLCTDAFGLAGTRLRAHQVAVTDGKLESRVLDIKAQRIVLATGSAERLPVFPGNRMPGVVGAVTAFHRAERYGVWNGNRALFSTPHNFSYRLALLAADAGVAVQRVVDARIGPQSRFVDFCKASGVTLASGLVPRSAESVRGEKGALSVGFAVAIEDAGGETAPITTDLLVAAGGWQPRLALWLMAGGRCAYDTHRFRLAAEGSLDAIALAGAAAGFRSSTACIASGAKAIATLLGKDPAPVEELEVDAIYESLDAATSIAPWRAGRGAAFLDGGLGFTARPHQARNDTASMLPEAMGALSVGDVAASVGIGAIPAADAGIIAEERCLGTGDLADSGWRIPPSSDTPTTEPPAYLHGRFGPKPQLAVIAASDSRHFEPGGLVYASSDVTDPFAAIGVVIGPAPEGKPGGLIAANRPALSAAPALFVRDTSGPIPVRVVEKLKAAAGDKPA